MKVFTLLIGAFFFLVQCMTSLSDNPAKPNGSIARLPDSISPDTTMGHGPQLFNLKDPPTHPRFALTDRVWPQTVGDAAVCLWADDKLAAVSITVDDNAVPEHDWWIQQTQKYGFNMTWFVIVNQVTEDASFYGPWSAFERLSALGNDIQSHTMNHLDIQATPVSDSVLSYEYGEAVRAIDANIPGRQCLTIGYPFCRQNLDIASRYYIAGRGCLGWPNTANSIYYMNTNCGFIDPSWIDRLITNTSGSDGKYWRGWIVPLYHSMAEGQTPAAKQAFTSALISDLDYMAGKKDQLWIAPFTAVAQYGEERDTHVLTVVQVTNGSISMRLTDSMNDALFDYPLTVKVRIDNSWGDAVQAFQNGNRLEAAVVRHDGNAYALVKAVPDRGIVVVQPKFLFSLLHRSGVLTLTHLCEVNRAAAGRIKIDAVLSKPLAMRVWVSNLNGTPVAALGEGLYSAGTASFTWNYGAARGLYFITFSRAGLPPEIVRTTIVS